ncbi:MAG: MFS transporter [Alsobacter sp.]
MIASAGTVSPLEHVSGLREQWATRAAFFVVGVSVGGWAPLVPFAKERLSADEASLGALLLCLGLGSMITMPVSGILLSRMGCRALILIPGIVLCLAMPLLAVASSFASLGVVLVAFGGAMGTMDVAMNTQSVLVEKDSAKPMMSGFHGMWSVGGIAGSAFVSLMLWLGATPPIGVVAVGCAALLSLAGPGMLPYGNKEADVPLFVAPRGPVLFLGLLCFIVFLAEGVVLDWGALFLSDKGMDPAEAGFGYAAFATSMTIGRLFGDRVVATIGGLRILLFGSLMVATGFTLAVYAPSPVTAIAGFLLVGAGASNIVPVLFSLGGRQTLMPASHAISAITTVAYAGVLLGPAMVGFVAHGTSLSIALLLVAALMLMVTLGARVAR